MMIILGSLRNRVVDFLFALTEFFSLGVTSAALRAITGLKLAISLQREPVDPKFQVEGVAVTNHCTSQKTRLNDLSYGIKIRTYLSTDRQTDRQTDRRQTTDGRTTTYSEHEHEFTFANK